MRILIDMDDTLEHLSDAWVAYLNKKYHRDVIRENVNDWDISKFYPGLDKTQVFDPLLHEELWETVQPFEDAPDILLKFIEEGHEIYVVTSSTYKSLKSKLDLALFRYFPFLNNQNVIVTYNKQMIKGDVLIDDAVHNLVGGDYVKILMDAPYNRDYDAENNGMTRVKNWKEVYEVIKQLEKTTEAKEMRERLHGVGVYSGKKKMRNDIFGEENDEK